MRKFILAAALAAASATSALAGERFSEIRNALPFRDDEEGRALRDRFDAAIATLKENGKLAEISQKWFGTDITK